jgi:xylulokinase
MFLGLDIGTSAVKAVLADERQRVRASATVPLATQRPHPLWSEQDPDRWWTASAEALAGLRAAEPQLFAAVAAIGLSGQMHAATLLDESGRPLRPAILWNDGRSHREAARLREDHPDIARLTGVPAMAGFTGPKLLWLARHEPEILRRTRRILCAKDVVRLRLTGEALTDPSDAAGTWFLDEARRAWCPRAVEACGIPEDLLPGIVEGSAVGGRLRPGVAAELGLPAGIPVAGGAGDAAAGAVGLGAVEDGDAFVSLGTSAQLFVTRSSYEPAPERMVHAFCHPLPGRWSQIAALLNGASCLAFAERLFGTDVGTLVAESEREFRAPAEILFLPYLTGERTPHDDPHARGVLFGLAADTPRALVVQAILEGVAFSFADAQDALAAAGTAVRRAGMVGGGARSLFWARIIASVMNVPLTRYRGAEHGPAFGAARLARLVATGEAPASVCTPPDTLDVVEPVSSLVDTYRPRVAAFRGLYAALRDRFPRD